MADLDVKPVTPRTVEVTAASGRTLANDALAPSRPSSALALIDGEAFVRPEHIQELAVAVLAHRLVLDPQARFAGGSARAIVEHIVQTLPVPA